MTQRDVTRPTTVGAGVAGSWSPLADQQVVLEHVTPARAAFRRFLRHRLAIIGVVIVTTIILLAILAPLLTPWPPNKIDFTTGSRHAPNAAHILGTDVSARDIWSRVLYGGRTSTVVGFGAVALYLVIGLFPCTLVSTTTYSVGSSAFRFPHAFCRAAWKLGPFPCRSPFPPGPVLIRRPPSSQLQRA